MRDESDSKAELVISAQAFGRATTVLRDAHAIAKRRPLRGAGKPDRAQDERLRVISQELRNSLRALKSVTTLYATQGSDGGFVIDDAKVGRIKRADELFQRCAARKAE